MPHSQSHPTEHFGRHDNIPPHPTAEILLHFDGESNQRRVNLNDHRTPMPNSRQVKLQMVPENMQPSDTSLVEQLFEEHEEDEIGTTLPESEVATNPHHPPIKLAIMGEAPNPAAGLQIIYHDAGCACCIVVDDPVVKIIERDLIPIVSAQELALPPGYAALADLPRNGFARKSNKREGGYTKTKKFIRRIRQACFVRKGRKQLGR